MAKWMEFTKDHDHRWPSRAVTAFKAGMKVYVKDSVAEAAKDAGAAKPCSKPAKSEDGYRATSDPLETPAANPGNPVPNSAAEESRRIQAGATEPDPATMAPAAQDGGDAGKGADAGGKPADPPADPAKED